MKPGDKVRIKGDERTLEILPCIGLTSHQVGQQVTIEHSSSTWTNLYGPAWRCSMFTIPECCLELVDPSTEVTPKPPKKHARGLRLNAFAKKEISLGSYNKTWSIKIDKMVPRVPELRALHGQPFVRLLVSNPQPKWFTNMVNYAGLSFDTVTGMVTKANGQKLKATKWVSNVGVAEAQVQELALSLISKTFDMTLSVRFKDLLRASISRNFSSCWNNSGITELLERPNIAIAGVKDKHGDYLSRWIVWWDDEEKRCILNPVPYPQKFDWSGAYALTDKVTIWNSYGVSNGARFNYSKFCTERLYNELDKGGHTLKQLSMAEDCHKNNENTETPA